MSVTVTVEDGTGLAGANAYASVSDADAYFEARPRSEAWQTADADAKARLLIQATQILDRSFKWAGAPANTDQALAFPRYSRDFPDILDGESVPDFLADALFELALLLATEDLTAAPDSAGLAEIAIGSLDVKLDPSRIRRFPPWVNDLVAPYGITHESSSTARITRA